MAQIVEYTLVLLCSVMIAAFSIGAYSMYIGAVYGARYGPAVSTIAASAAGSLAQGASSTTANLDGLTIGCHGGMLTVSSPSASRSLDVGRMCDFRVSGLSGTHTLTFVSSPGEFSVEVK